MFPLILTVLNRKYDIGGGGGARILTLLLSIRGNIPSEFSRIWSLMKSLLHGGPFSLRFPKRDDILEN